MKTSKNFRLMCPISLHFRLSKSEVMMKFTISNDLTSFNYLNLFSTIFVFNNLYEKEVKNIFKNIFNFGSFCLLILEYNYAFF